MLTILLAALVGAAASQPLLTFSPAVLPSTGSVITIKWSGVTGVTADDHISLYATGNNGQGVVLHELGYVYANMSTGWESGSGVLSFPLVNLRETLYSFAYKRVSGWVGANGYFWGLSPVILRTLGIFLVCMLWSTP